MKEETKLEHRIAICIDNSDYEMSLERRKVYPVLPNADAERDNYIALSMKPVKTISFPPTPSSFSPSRPK